MSYPTLAYQYAVLSHEWEKDNNFLSRAGKSEGWIQRSVNLYEHEERVLRVMAKKSKSKLHHQLHSIEGRIKELEEFIYAPCFPDTLVLRLRKLDQDRVDELILQQLAISRVVDEAVDKRPVFMPERHCVARKNRVRGVYSRL